jgi:energy-coupling factor transport system permease protein
VTALDVLAGPVGVDTSAPVARANPVAKLAVASTIAFALVLTVDVVTAATALALQAAVLPWCGLGPRMLLRRGWIVLLSCVPAGVATALLGVDSGEVLLGAGWLTVTEGSATSGVAISLRILAIGLPGVVLLATTDPTDLADGLGQLVRLPARFVLAALAAMRLFGVLAEELAALRLARRARGLGDDGLAGRVRTAAGLVFALLVLAVRRATVLATTMESRGFGTGHERTWARESRFARRDAVVVLGVLAIAVLATWAGVAAGTWDLVLS